MIIEKFSMIVYDNMLTVIDKLSKETKPVFQAPFGGSFDIQGVHL